ncbi:hypothetical protein LTR37_014828 [Vermiconidia calcicola]|uniref:Uncharacterized protein n=1 Tax=Vermiconidia calcicola TaxID=1690605 RepID=A0ACC3MSL3_9PEZI|nr:hypothetical protein LTR37_014828 [Vermiconidia calcicola]
MSERSHGDSEQQTGGSRSARLQASPSKPEYGSGDVGQELENSEDAVYSGGPAKEGRSTKRVQGPKTRPQPVSVQSEDDLEPPAKGKGKAKSSRRPPRSAIVTGKLHVDSESKKSARRPKRKRSHQDDDFLLAGEDLAAAKSFGPSITLPSTQQELLDMGMNNLNRLQRYDFPVPQKGEPAPKWEAASRWIREIAAFAPKSNRDWRCVSAKLPLGYNYWVFGFKVFHPHGTDSTTIISVKPKTLTNILPACFKDESEALVLGHRICEYLNRWPVPIPPASTDDNRKTGEFWPVLAFTAFFDIRPDHDNSIEASCVLPLPSMPPGSKPPQYRVGLSKLEGYSTHTARSTLPLFTEEGVRNAFRSLVKKEHVDLSVAVPDFPSWWPVQDPIVPSDVPADQKASVQQALKIAGYVSYRMCGCLGTAAQQKASIEELTQPFLKRKRSDTTNSRGVYGGKAFVG